MGGLALRAVPSLVLPLCLCGCSLLSQSSDSVSTSVEKGLGSVSDSFGSISGSASGGGGSSASTGARYRADLLAYARTTLSEEERAGEGDEFVREVGRIAERHGITDWEGNESTAAALREALASGAVGPDGLARLRRDLAPLGAAWLDGALATPPSGDEAAAEAATDAGSGR